MATPRKGVKKVAIRLLRNVAFSDRIRRVTITFRLKEARYERVHYRDRLSGLADFIFKQNIAEFDDV
jgi:hypothetical protein